MHARRQPRRVIATRPMARRRRRRRALVALGITSAVVAGTAYGTWQYIEDREFLLEERCEVTVGEQAMTLSPAQTNSAAALSAAAADRGLPPQAAVHAVAMSLQETELTADESEEDGTTELFARGNPSWSDGPSAEVAETSIAGFYNVLEESWSAGQSDEGSYDSEDEAAQHWDPQMELDEAAEVLQRPHNAQFYPQHLPTARAFAWPLVGQQPVDMTCHISQLEVPGPDPEGVVDDIAATMPNALQIPFTEPPEGEAENSEDDAEEFVAEPILTDIVESSGDGEDTVLRVQVPEPDDSADYQWMLAHWAIAVAREYGIQTVEAGAYTWDRDAGGWERDDEGSASNTEVIIGFTRDS